MMYWPLGRDGHRQLPFIPEVFSSKRTCNYNSHSLPVGSGNVLMLLDKRQYISKGLGTCDVKTDVSIFKCWM